MIRILPKDKSDLEACANLALAGDDLIEPHIKELLSWLQDMNWPVAKKVSSRLSTLGMGLVPELREILNSNDESWKFWLVSNFLYEVNDKVYDALFFNLKRIQNHPTTGEVKARLNTEAEILIRSRKTSSHIVKSENTKTLLAENADPKKDSSHSSSSISKLELIETHSKHQEKPLIIFDGNHFDTLETFYNELETSFGINYNWHKNLDGFHEIIESYLNESLNGYVIRWENSELSKKNLGYDETIRQLNKRLEKCHPAKKTIVEDSIKKAEAGIGLTVFDWIVQIIQFYTTQNVGEGSKIELELK